MFNIVCDKTILNFKSVSGEVLSRHISDERLIYLVMKKIANDRLADLKVRKGLDCRKTKDKLIYSKDDRLTSAALLI